MTRPTYRVTEAYFRNRVFRGSYYSQSRCRVADVYADSSVVDILFWGSDYDWSMDDNPGMSWFAFFDELPADERATVAALL